MLGYSHDDKLFIGDVVVPIPKLTGEFVMTDAFTATAPTSMGLFCKSVGGISTVARLSADVIISEIAAVD